MKKLLLIPLALAAIAFAACDSGTEPAATYMVGTGGQGGEGGSPSVTASSSSSSSTSSTSSSTSSTSSSTSSSSSSSSGGGGGTGGAGGCDYTSPNNCAMAQEIPEIAGDENNDTRTVHGTTSKWLKIKVKEAVSSIIDFPATSYTATLDSPPGMNYDLYLYTGDANAPTCGGQPDHAVGTPEKFGASWGDTLNSDDTKWITLEVRYISGMECGPAAEWTLTVVGNTGGN